MLTLQTVSPQVLVPIVLLLGAMHCAIGYAAAQIAINKGRSRDTWIPLGLVAGTPALIAALFLKAEFLKEDLKESN
jgi:hypothetical protein